MLDVQQHGGPASTRMPRQTAGTTISTDSSGGADIGLSLTGTLASVWGGIVGVAAVVSVYIDGSDWYYVLKMAYGTGFLLTVTALLFYYGVLSALSDPERRPINGPVEVDILPDGTGERRVSVLYYKELPVDKEGRKNPSGDR